MFDRRYCSCLCIAAAIAVLSAGGPTHSAETLKLQHQGVERTAVLYRPAGLAEAPRPLVIALHGLGGIGENFRSFAGFDDAAVREGFVAVYPDAVKHAWSYGRPINQPMPKVESETVDDVGFIRLLIDDLVGRKIADPKRIYVTGLSRGGLMTFTLACALADRIAAAASLISGMTEFQRDDCRPSRPVPMMVLAGTSDRMQAFGGAQGLRGRLLSVAETMDFWRSLHGCTRRSPRALPHRDASDKTQVTVVEWSDCRTGANPRLYRIEGGGHQIPSIKAGGNPMSEEKFGPRNHDIETAEEVWAFFKSFSLSSHRGSSPE